MNSVNANCSQTMVMRELEDTWMRDALDTESMLELETKTRVDIEPSTTLPRKQWQFQSQIRKGR